MKIQIFPCGARFLFCVLIFGLLLVGRFHAIYGQASVETPVHFGFTANTGDSYPVLVLSAQINGVDLEPGDEIGAFTPDGQCVGALLWKGDREGFAIWEDDTQTTLKDGLVPGEPISFKFWDRNTGLELEVSKIEYIEGDEAFSSEVGAVVHLEVLISSALGDVNGDGKIDFGDAIKVLQFYVGIISLTPEQQENANVDSNDVVDYRDAQHILRFSIDIIDSFPRDQN